MSDAGSGCASAGSTRADADPRPQRPRGPGAAPPRRRSCTALGIASRTDRLGNLIATIEGDADAPERDAVRPHGPARPRSCARSRRTGWSGSSGWAACRRRRCRRRRCCCASARAATCPASSPTRAITRRRRRRSTACCPIRSSTSTPASAAPTEVLAAGIDIGTPVVYAPKVVELAGGRHRRHLGRRPRRLRRDGRGGAGAAATRKRGRPCISSSRCRRSSTCAAR